MSLSLPRPLRIFAALCLLVSCRAARQPEPAAGQPQPRVLLPQEPAEARAPYQATPAKVFDLLHTRLEVQPDWATQRLSGTATLRLKPHFYPQHELVLDAKGFDIAYVGVVQVKRVPVAGSRKGGKPKTERQETERKAPYSYNGKQLTVTLDRTYTRFDTVQLLIEYTAKPNELIRVDSSAEFYNDKGLFFINPLGQEPDKPRQIWTQGETDRNSCWFPTLDQPNQRMTQELYITVEPQYQTLSNGSLIYSRNREGGLRTDYWKFDQPHPPYLAMMAIGEFAVVEDKWRDLPLQYYVEPAYRSTAKKIFGRTPAMLEYFSQQLGVVYPWEKYAQVVVRDYVSGAMENTTASVFMEAVQADARELLDEDWDGIIAHELFHQWFGDLVTCESWANLALNEGFATYGSILWAGKRDGPDAFQYALLNELQTYLREARHKQDPIIQHRYHDPDDLFDSHRYAKAGLVLHMLREQVGEEAFFAALKLYLTRHRLQTVELADLRQAFEEVAGQDLQWFFRQWFERPGHPVLQVNSRYENGQLKVQVAQLQDTVAAAVYRLPLQIAIWSNGERQVQLLHISQARQQFTYPLAAAPDLVLPDPEYQLLGELRQEKSRAELLYQFRHGQHFRARYEALQQLGGNATDPEVREVLLAALQDPFHEIRSAAVGAFGGHTGPDAGKAGMQLQQLALSEPQRTVRAEAISVLAGWPDPAPFLPVFEAGLRDSSYQVVGASVRAYAKLQGAAAMSRLQPLESLSKGTVVLALADVYAELKPAGKAAWFRQQVQTQRGWQRSLLLNSYGQYLLQQDKATQQEALPLLEQLARQDPNYHIRLAAFQSLDMLDKLPQTEELQRQIKAAETDPRLRRIYQNMP